MAHRLDLPFDDDVVPSSGTISVSELSARLKELVERGFTGIAVEGDLERPLQFEQLGLVTYDR